MGFRSQVESFSWMTSSQTSSDCHHHSSRAAGRQLEPQRGYKVVLGHTYPSHSSVGEAACDQEGGLR